MSISFVAVCVKHPVKHEAAEHNVVQLLSSNKSVEGEKNWLAKQFLDVIKHLNKVIFFLFIINVLILINSWTQQAAGRTCCN